MKKILSLILIAMMLFAFAGCNNTPEPDGDTDNTLGTIVGGEITWDEDKADPDVVGAWQLTDGGNGEYYIFTEDCKVQVVRGTVSFEGEAAFGVDDDGIRSYFSEFEHLYGQLTYTIAGDTLTFLSIDGTQQSLVRADYTPVKLTPADDVKVDEELLGYWHNDEYNDSYEFTADGFATFKHDQLETLGHVSMVEYIYSANGSKAELTYHNGAELSVYPGGEYTIDGDTLTIDGNEYTRTEKSAE